MVPFTPKPPAGSPPYMIAHRGISSKAPENTMAAFRRAVETPGVDMIELDVRLSREEEVIVLHDRTLQRTTTGNGPARNYTVEEIKTFDAGSWFNPEFSSERVPTLREVLELLQGRCWANIEIKSDMFYREREGLVERKVLEVVRQAGMERHVLYSSFDHRLVANLKHIDPAAETGVIYNIWRDFGRLPSKLAQRAGASVFVCARRELRRAMIRDIHQSGLALYVYTLNSKHDVRRLQAVGVHGVLSDVADEIVGEVKSLSSATTAAPGR